MQDYRITKSQLTSSSVWGRKYDAYYARLNGKQLLRNSGAWCAKLNDLNQWISVNLSMPRLISGVITQGRKGSKRWVTRFKIQYSSDGVSWLYIMDSTSQDEKARTKRFYILSNACLVHMSNLNFK